jgi:hypothetical protein
MKFSSMVIILILLTAVGSHAQLMPTPYDAQKLKDNDSLFIGKPLRTLLKEIGAPIKVVFTESHGPHKALSLLLFKFVDSAGMRRYERAGIRSLSVLVYVYENFDWNKPIAMKTQWTPEDAGRLGHLTVARIGIVGQYLGDDPSALF